MRVNKATYVPNHALHLRVKPALFAWLMSRAEEQALPVATYTNRRLEELAKLDLQRGEVASDDDLHSHAG
jgi:hypothetical protein